MTWPTVPSVVSGKGMVAAWGNTVKDANDNAGRYRKRARCCRTSGITGPIGPSGGNIAALSGVYTDTVLFDNDSMCTGGFMEINTAGVWLLTLTAEWVDNGAATPGLRSVEIWEATTSRHLCTEQKAAAATGISTYHSIFTMEVLDTTALLQARVAQSSGINAYFYSGWWGLCLSAFLVTG